jgi:sugar lactone lactonase YvrE
MNVILMLTLVLGAGAELIAGDIETVAEGFKFTEGPVWMPGEGLLFSDIPADTIYRADKTVFRRPSGQSNGLTLDKAGRLLAAEHANRRVSRTEKDGSITVLADRYEGKRLNSPNDLVVRSDGVIFFTDPPYGLPGGLDGDQAELDFSGVYAILADGTLKLLKKDFIKPNGITLSPDEKTLYVADTEGRHIRAFDVAADAALSNDRVFHKLPGPDGIKTDTRGNVWATCGLGVQIISPERELLKTVKFPQNPANCAFGGDDYQTLFVTARTGLYKVPVGVRGIAPGPAGKKE